MILRDLKACDIFPAVRILKKIGVTNLKDYLTLEKIKELTSGELDESVIGYDLMFELMGIIVDHLPDCEVEIFRFMSGLSGLTVEQLQDLPIGEFLDGVMDVFKKHEFKDFFEAVSKYLK